MGTLGDVEPELAMKFLADSIRVTPRAADACPGGR
jgi:hypothetical protein